MRDWRLGVLVATAAMALLTAVLVASRDDVGLLNGGLLLLLLTLIVSTVWGREVGIYAAVIANLSLNFFFIDPLETFDVSDPKNIVALVVFLVVSVVGGGLLSVAQKSAAEAKRRQAETEVALHLSRSMSGQLEPEKALAELCAEVVRAFSAPGAAVFTREGVGWRLTASAGNEQTNRPFDGEERAAAERAASTGEFQGIGRTGLSQAIPRRIVIPGGRRGAYDLERSVALVPLKLADYVLGILRVDGPIGDSPFRSNPEGLLMAVAAEGALTLQRVELAREATHARALREADEMKTALMASISHDLKTPLAAIKAAISSIMDKRVAWSEEDIEAFTRTIDSQADRLNRIISDILDLNRIESGALAPERLPVRALDLLNRAREVTAHETTGREVTVEAAPELRAVVDESLIVQALVNLIENAAKYSRQEGAIHLRAVAEAGRAVIIVEDEGPGIAPEDLPYVFQRFYRAQEHSRRVKGSGLGLSVVKGFVELCGGGVGVESSPRGTRFVIRLPAAVDEIVTA